MSQPLEQFQLVGEARVGRPGLPFGSLESIRDEQASHHFFADRERERRRDDITDLRTLMLAGPQELEVIWEALEPCCLARGQWLIV